MIVRHRNTPLRHGARGVLACDVLEHATRLLVLEGVQQSDALLEIGRYSRRAGRREMDRAEFLFSQLVMMPFVRPRGRKGKGKEGQQSDTDAHMPPQWGELYCKMASANSQARRVRFSASWAASATALAARRARASGVR